MMRREKELRCFCRGQPLLATYGVDEKGALFVHLKIYKRDRIYGEAVYMGGVVKFRCRNCLRWHKVVFREDGAALSETSSPLPQPSNQTERAVLDAADDR